MADRTNVLGELRQMRHLADQIGERCDRWIARLETEGLAVPALSDESTPVWMLTVEEFGELITAAVDAGFDREYHGAESLQDDTKGELQ